MARGRKKMIAGWGLVGFGVIVGAAITASRWRNVRYSRSSMGAGGYFTRELSVRSGVFIMESEHDPAPDVAYDPGTWTEFSLDRNDFVELEWWFTNDTASAPWPGIFDLYQPWAVKPGVTFGSFCMILWPIAALFLAGGSTFLVADRKSRQRSRTGLCVHCGYDLKGLRAEAGCPECGKARVG